MSASSTASSSSTAAGSGCEDRSANGTRTYSACVPSTRWPRTQPPPPRHWPYAARGRTGSGRRRRCRRPAPGRPGRTRAHVVADLDDLADGLVAQDRAGRTSGTSPLRMCRSVPQMVTASTRTMASVASWMPGSGTSCQERCPGPWKTSAFMAASSRAGRADGARCVPPRTGQAAPGAARFSWARIARCAVPGTWRLTGPLLRVVWNAPGAASRRPRRGYPPPRANRPPPRSSGPTPGTTPMPELRFRVRAPARAAPRPHAPGPWGG